MWVRRLLWRCPSPVLPRARPPPQELAELLGDDRFATLWEFKE